MEVKMDITLPATFTFLPFYLFTPFIAFLVPGNCNTARR